MSCKQVSDYTAVRALRRAQSVGQTEGTLDCPTCDKKVTVHADGRIVHGKAKAEASSSRAH